MTSRELLDVTVTLLDGAREDWSVTRAMRDGFECVCCGRQPPAMAPCAQTDDGHQLFVCSPPCEAVSTTNDERREAGRPPLASWPAQEG